MAKNWTLKEAVEVITAGKNKEAMQEIGKRFPLTALAIAKMGCNEGVAALMSVMPEHMTMLKLERAFKEGVIESDEETEEVEDVEETTDEQDLSNMTSKQLYALCIKKGIKAKKYGVNKQYYLELLEGDIDASEDEVDEETEENDEEVIDYKTMKAPELYSLCKKRGIKVEPRQKAAVYIKALEAAEVDNEDEDEDWDEEETKVAKKTPASKKTAPKASEKKTASGKKTSAKAVEEDDEDWDI